MECIKLILFLLILTTSCSKQPKAIPSPLTITIDSIKQVNPIHSHILYLAQKGEIKEALSKYNEIFPTLDTQHYSLLQKLAYIIIKKGYQSDVPEENLLALYGAATSKHNDLFYILEGSLKNRYPQIQLAALNFLGHAADFRGNNDLNEGMSSPYLPVRLEAAYWLALTKAPTATGQIESLMNKLPKETHPYFPQLFALNNTSSAIKVLHHLILKEDNLLSSQAIIQSGNYQIEELLPVIRTLSKHINPYQQEACAFSFGEFQDTYSIPVLQQYTKSHLDSLQLIATISLIKMGEKQRLPDIVTQAKKGNLFAITSLTPFDEENETLYELSLNSNPQIRLNANIALLKQKDPRALVGLESILIPLTHTPTIIPTYNSSKTLQAFKLFSKAKSPEELQIYQSITTEFRKHILITSQHLPSNHFYLLCEKIFNSQQQELIPTCIHLLEKFNTEEAISLLKKGKMLPGNPLIRTYCSLALFRLSIQKYEEKELLYWVYKENHRSLITFQTVIPWQYNRENTPHQLTPNEKSQLLIEIFQTLAEKQHPHTVQTLINVMIKGNPSNCYALAGLLIRATE